MYSAYNQIIQVNGEQGAMAYRMMPSSSALLLDVTKPIVWLCQTDDAGYKTITPYKIERYEPPAPPDFNALIHRLEKIEERLNNNEQSDFTGNIIKKHSTEQPE